MNTEPTDLSKYTVIDYCEFFPSKEVGYTFMILGNVFKKTENLEAFGDGRTWVYVDMNKSLLDKVMLESNSKVKN